MAVARRVGLSRSHAASAGLSIWPLSGRIRQAILSESEVRIRAAIDSTGGHPLMNTTRNFDLRVPRVSDGPRMWELVQAAGTLDLNSPYTYLMLSRFFTQTCIVAQQGNDLAGFVSAFRVPERQQSLMIWQVGVHPRYRRRGLAHHLIHQLLERPGLADVGCLEATVTPDNTASDALFRSIADRYQAEVLVEPCFEQGLFPGGQHQPELLYHIAPIRTA